MTKAYVSNSRCKTVHNSLVCALINIMIVIDILDQNLHHPAERVQTQWTASKSFYLKPFSGFQVQGTGYGARGA